MNATKFVVLLIFVGVVCVNVGARKLEDVSKETKLGISVPKTATTNGLGAELGIVTAYTDAYNSEYSDSSAAAGPGGPSADASGSVYKSTSGYVRAEGYTGSNSAAGPNGASGNRYASGNAYSNAYGDTTTP